MLNKQSKQNKQSICKIGNLKYIKKYLMIMMMVIISTLCLGDITVETDTDTIDMNNTFNLQVIFTNEERQEYTLEGLDNFSILSRGQTANVSVINGKQTVIQSDIYSLIPKSEGTYTLKAVSKGKSSNEVRMLVTKGKIVDGTSGAELQYISSIKDDATFYFGEKIPYTENFVMYRDIMALRHLKAPSFINLSSKDITEYDRNNQFIQRGVSSSSGARGREFDIHKSILEATASGNAQISTGAMAVTDNMGRQSVLGENRININIMPLPSNKPNNFQNIVGELQGEQSWNRDKINYGESVVLTVRLYGNVNLDGIDGIIKNTLSQDDFNIFESIKSSRETIRAGKYYAEKNFEIAIVPKGTGKITVPAITIPYFNTATKKYENYTIPAKTITVSGNASKQAVTPSNNTPANNGSSDSNSSHSTNVSGDPNTGVSSSQASVPKETIKIETIPSEKSQIVWYTKYSGVILVIAIAELVAILALVYKLAKSKKTSQDKYINKSKK